VAPAEEVAEQGNLHAVVPGLAVDVSGWARPAARRRPEWRPEPGTDAADVPDVNWCGVARLRT
jgi:hypothetical protein